MFTKAEHEAATRPESAPEAAPETAPAPAGFARPPRVTFLGAMCLLDQVSGAAISVRSMMETLAAAGFEARAFTASLFDANAEVDYAPVLGRQATEPSARGKLLRLRQEGVEHLVFLTASSRGMNMTGDEKAQMIARWEEQLARTPPDIVVTFGTSALTKRMQAMARRAGAQIVFYFGNAEVEDREAILPGDRLVCPAHALAATYRERLGVEATVLHSVIARERIPSAEEPTVAADPALRRLGLVTFINPIPHKGLTLFIRLARRAAVERPDMRFLVLEGRMTRDLLRKMGPDIASWPNVWWLPAQRDLRAVWARTSVLLMPSFWREGFGRSVTEAQLTGIPVIASTRGGLPDSLNGGGFALDIPDACAENHYTMPDDATVDRWWEVLCRLWDDEAAYAEASARARAAAERYRPEATTAAIAAYFTDLAAARIGRGAATG